MHPEMEMLRCAIIRGGTSKGIFIRNNELPQDPQKRDAVIKAIYGSPDVRQIDGLGGADVLTSKLAIISPPSREDADVDYTFGQVGIESDVVDYSGNCGNLAAAVGAYAVDEGMVIPEEPITTVRIHLTNTHNILIAEVPVYKGKAKVCGNCAIDGVPGTGARITVDWSDTVGGVTGNMLPTGHVKDRVAAGGKEYEISIVDAANVLVFIHARSLGMKGTESAQEIEGNAELMRTIEQIRGAAAVKLGFVQKAEDAAKLSPYLPFFAIVSEPAGYVAGTKKVAEEDVDLNARLLFMLHMHKAYPITGTISTATAARIPGTIVWEVLREEAHGRKEIRIGHPGGTLPVEAEAKTENGEVRIKKLGVFRTARRIMDGTVYVKKEIMLS